jgi:hypothetical protein
VMAGIVALTDQPIRRFAVAFYGLILCLVSTLPRRMVAILPKTVQSGMFHSDFQTYVREFRASDYGKCNEWTGGRERCHEQTVEGRVILP